MSRSSTPAPYRASGVSLEGQGYALGAVSLDDNTLTGNGGNPNLKPIRSTNYDATLEWYFAPKSALSVGVFYMDMSSYVTFGVSPATYYNNTFKKFNTYQITSPSNIAAKNKGVELGWAFHGDAWRARAELTLQDPRDESTDTRLLRRSREALSVAVNRDVGKFDIGMDVVASGNRKEFGFPMVTLDSYALLNATLRYRATPHLTVQGRFENLLDEDYAFAEGYRTEGRAWTVGVRYSFE
jgi:outer membrane cobalamin receptor